MSWMDDPDPEFTPIDLLLIVLLILMLFKILITGE